MPSCWRLSLRQRLGRPQLMGVSIAGAALGATLVYGLAAFSRGGLTPVRLTLTGVAVSAVLGAVGNGVRIYCELGQDALLWHARGTEGIRWIELGLFTPLAAARSGKCVSPRSTVRGLVTR